MKAKHWSEFRPATMIEIEMVFALNRIKLSPNRERFVTQLAADYTFNDRLSQKHVITDKQAAFLARCVWRYRESIEPRLVLAAMLKGGTEPSPWQKQASKREQDRRLQARYYEDPTQLSFLEDA